MSRRRFLARASLAIACMGLETARGQPGGPGAAPSDAFQTIRARAGSAALRGPRTSATTIWGYDGAVPGPTLRVKRGEEVKVRLVNELPEPTAVHWHGVRIANAMDGVPGLTQPPVAPGESFDYRFMVPDAGTFWYHPPLDASAQLGRGLFGALIVEEPQPVDVDHDIVLVFADWHIAADGSIDAASFVTVNGGPNLDIAVRANERLRLRLINAATARILTLRIDRHQALVTAIDGEPAEPFLARHGRIALGSGNRVDLFVDATLTPGARAPLTLETDGGEEVLARLVYDAAPAVRPQPRPDPLPLPANPLPERIDLARALKVDIPLEGWRERSGNGPPLFSVRRGRAVMLALTNRGEAAHVVHVHGHHFRLLDRLDDGWKPFWLDTLLVPAGQSEHVAFVADNPGKWRIDHRPLGQAQAAFVPWFDVR